MTPTGIDPVSLSLSSLALLSSYMSPTFLCLSVSVSVSLSLSLCLSVSVSLSLSVSVSGALWLEFDPLACWAPFRVPLLYNGRRKVLSVMLSL